MKQNDFITSVFNILRPYGEKYNVFQVEGAMWAALRNLNTSRGFKSLTFSRQQEAFVRRTVTILRLDCGKAFGWKFDIRDVKKAVVTAMREVGE